MGDALPGPLLESLVTLAEAAGERILQYWQTQGLRSTQKADDSPVTCADIDAHRLIERELPALWDLPILSEEGHIAPYAERRQWDRYWLIDPLDGTREFIRSSTEFTVNIALIDNDRPLLGVIHGPALGVSYAANLDPALGPVGSYRREGAGWVRLGSRPLGEKPALVSGHRQSSATERRLQQAIEQLAGEPRPSTGLGSSYKFCALAEGRFDLYPRLGPTSEWDTAAGQAILEAAGGAVLDAQTLTPLRYNQTDSLLNRPFWAVGDNASERGQSFWQALHERL